MRNADIVALYAFYSDDVYKKCCGKGKVFVKDML
jgi:hypothetical protein